MKSNEKHSCSSQTMDAKSDANGGSMQERIRARAYDLYLARGRQDGHADEDWAQAEKEMRGSAPNDKNC